MDVTNQAHTQKHRLSNLVSYQINWSPNSQYFSASTDKGIIVWNVKDFKTPFILNGHTDIVRCIAWSPSGEYIASGSDDKSIKIWSLTEKKVIAILSGHENYVRSLSWSNDGSHIISGSTDGTLRSWNVSRSDDLDNIILAKNLDTIFCVAYSPNNELIAVGSAINKISVFNLLDQSIFTLSGHSNWIRTLCWSPDGRFLASGSWDRTVRIWDVKNQREISRLEGHTGRILALSFSYDGRLLASLSGGNGASVYIWQTETWESLLGFSVFPDIDNPCLAFNPMELTLASPSRVNKEIQIQDINYEMLIQMSKSQYRTQYRNAKIVLMGDSGVGKSGLGLVLSGQPFVATESTHGRHVWLFDEETVQINNRISEERETLLWDMAGQAGYRVVHQLHLNEVAIGLVLFDDRNETDPFSGVYHWTRALRQSHRIEGNAALPLKLFLVASRIDRGGVSVGKERLESIIKELGFDGYYETSARDGINIAALINFIKQGIEWDNLPMVSSSELFQDIKDFLVRQKIDGRILTTTEDLYRIFLATSEIEETEDLSLQFDTCIGLVESRDLIRRLSFGKLILLQPELLDSYASALVNAVKDEPDGLGSILEERAKNCDFRISQDDRIKDRELERLLLIAMIEDLIRRELTLREETQNGAYLVFPSQSTRTNPDLPNMIGEAVIFIFEGPIQNIYATLAIRLSQSGLFKREELWKDAITYTALAGGKCGIHLKNSGEGKAELTLFFDKITGEETRIYFEEYVATHLKKWILQGSLRRFAIIACPSCGELISPSLLQEMIGKGLHFMYCYICSYQVTIQDTRENNLLAASEGVVSKMDISADKNRDIEVAKSSLQGKKEAVKVILNIKRAKNEFDVFICYNWQDSVLVKNIAEMLLLQGILPWLDNWELRPGTAWQVSLEEQISKIRSAAVFVGQNGIGPWQNMERQAFLSEFVKRGCPVIPVILPDCLNVPNLPVSLNNLTWVDFRKKEPKPLEQLIWGITGEQPDYILEMEEESQEVTDVSDDVPENGTGSVTDAITKIIVVDDAE